MAGRSGPTPTICGRKASATKKSPASVEAGRVCTSSYQLGDTASSTDHELAVSRRIPIWHLPAREEDAGRALAHAHAEPLWCLHMTAAAKGRSIASVYSVRRMPGAPVC